MCYEPLASAGSGTPSAPLRPLSHSLALLPASFRSLLALEAPWTGENLRLSHIQLRLHTFPPLTTLRPRSHSIVTVEPDPQTDLKHIAEAKDMMKKRFVTKLASR